MVSSTPRPQFTPGKDPVPILQEAGWAPGPGWKGAEYLTPTGIRSPDCPTRSELLYRLSYRGTFRPYILYIYILPFLRIRPRVCSLDRLGTSTGFGLDPRTRFLISHYLTVRCVRSCEIKETREKETDKS